MGNDAMNIQIKGTKCVDSSDFGKSQNFAVYKGLYRTSDRWKSLKY